MNVRRRAPDDNADGINARNRDGGEPTILRSITDEERRINAWIEHEGTASRKLERTATRRTTARSAFMALQRSF